jgi:hypothetical protein
MSQMTVRREIALMREQADALDAKCNDPAHVFTDERHRTHLRHEAARLRADALHEAEQLDHHLDQQIANRARLP